MGITTSIEWSDSTLNLQMGCDGCELWIPSDDPAKDERHCYAGILHERYAGKSKGYPESFSKPKIFMERLEAALKWPDLCGKTRPDKPWLNGRPRMIFLNDMGDTFTESLPLEWLADPVSIKGATKSALTWMAGSPHFYMLLTKRPKRMRRFFEKYPCPDNFILGTSITGPPNLHRLANLVEIRCRYRFVSIEPLRYDLPEGSLIKYLNAMHFVIVGGESGPKARPFNIQWAREIIADCQQLRTPVFIKQLGANPYLHRQQARTEQRGTGFYMHYASLEIETNIELRDSKGGDPSEWPEDLRIREFPEVSR